MRETNKAAYGMEIINSTYQGSVAQRAVQRAGHCKNLKGHIFEICYQDKMNMNPKNVITGKRAYLTKSPNAVRDDIIVKQNGKVIKRFQCKDTSSVSGARDTAKRIQSGQYSRTNVVGTSETSETVNSVLEKGDSKTSTRVRNSKISSKTTELIACQANGANPLKHMDLIGRHARQIAISAAAVGGGVSVIKNGREILAGIQDLDEGLTHIAADTGKVATSAAIGSAVDVSVTMAVAMIPPLIPLAKPMGMAAGMVSGFCADSLLKALEKHVDHHYDKIVERKIMSENDAYSYLKRQKVI